MTPRAAKVRRRLAAEHSAGRTLAALFGSLAAALAIGIALAMALPSTPALRVLLGAYAVFPVWVGLTCRVFLAASARHAWQRLSGLVLVAAIVAICALLFQRGAP
jgi:hypothetical protein